MKKIDLNKDRIETPFKVPDDYFDKLTGKIQERISVNETEPAPYFSWKWALAPAMVLVIALVFFFYPQSTEPGMDQILADVTDAQIEAYLELNDVSEYELALLIEDTEGLAEPDDYLEGIEINTDDLEMLIIDIEEIEQNIGS